MSTLPGAAENTAGKHRRGRPFERGTSGNPGGRPRGSRNRLTIALEALLQDEGEALTRKAIEMALGGDMVALRLCIDRLLPPRRDRPVTFALPKVDTAADALAASSAILQACASGALSPTEAREIMDLLATHVRTLETTEIEARLCALEKAQEQ